MPVEANPNANVVLPGNRKLYLVASILYGLAAISTIGNLKPAVGPHPYHPIWHWTGWLDIGVEAWCIYFLFEVLSALSNHIEEAICVLTILWFALGIPESLHRLGYSWAHVPCDRWVNLVVASLAAFLVFLRTFQVFHRRGA